MCLQGQWAQEIYLTRIGKLSVQNKRKQNFLHVSACAVPPLQSKDANGQVRKEDNRETLALVAGAQLEAGRMSGMLSNRALIKLGMVTCML